MRSSDRSRSSRGRDRRSGLAGRRTASYDVCSFVNVAHGRNCRTNRDTAPSTLPSRSAIAERVIRTRCCVRLRIRTVRRAAPRPIPGAAGTGSSGGESSRTDEMPSAVLGSAASSEDRVRFWSRGRGRGSDARSAAPLAAGMPSRSSRRVLRRARRALHVTTVDERSKASAVRSQAARCRAALQRMSCRWPFRPCSSRSSSCDSFCGGRLSVIAQVPPFDRRAERGRSVWSPSVRRVEQPECPRGRRQPRADLSCFCTIRQTVDGQSRPARLLVDHS